MHSLAIVGVDFDPSLDGQRFVAEGGVRLLVAVENQGRTQELNIQVMAQLLDSAGRAEGDTLLNETVVIEALDPGEIRLVPFSPVTTLPPRGRYKLVVQLSAAHDETELQDNSRAYDIVVNDAQ